MKQAIKLNLREQFQALFLAIDSTTIAMKNGEGKSFINTSIKDALTLPGFLQREYKWTDARYWYHSAKYYKKFADLTRLYRKWEAEIEFSGLNLHEYLLTGEFPTYRTHPKMQLLKQLIELADHLSTNDDFGAEMKFLTLEIELQSLLSASDRIVLFASGRSKVENLSIFEIFHKFLKATLAHLLGNCIKAIRRDLRQLFRNIIRFLFKNMNDESDAHNFLFIHPWNKRLLTLQIRQYDNQRNYRNFKTNTQSTQSCI